MDWVAKLARRKVTVLHVPCNQETVLRARGEPGDLRARRGLSRQGNGVGSRETRSSWEASMSALPTLPWPSSSMDP
ncbi:hypothetical protein ACOSQ4_007532 [Xanthoceras sorbifolium]